MGLLTRPLIQLREVSFSYESTHPNLLNQINLVLYPGERVALIGANGSGKSTLLQLLMGLLPPSAGEIEIFEHTRRTEQDFAALRGPLGLLFQDVDDQLFCPTVAEDIAFGPLNQGKSKTQVEIIVKDMLYLLGLQDYAERITYKLSTGEKRLVALAAVLAMQPAVLLLDEPTSGLDEDTEHHITQVLLHLSQAMLIVSHDRHFLDKIIHRKLLLKNGMITKYS